jgi:regulator of replication initiation timing
MFKGGVTILSTADVTDIVEAKNVMVRENGILRAENERLRARLLAFAERIFAQHEILQRRAEK